MGIEVDMNLKEYKFSIKKRVYHNSPWSDQTIYFGSTI